MAGNSHKDKEEEMLMMVHEMEKNFKNNNNNISNIKKSINTSISSSISGSGLNHQWWCFIAFTICCCLSHSVLGQMPSVLFANTTTKTTAATTTTTTTTSIPQEVTTTKTKIITSSSPLTPRVIVESIAVNEQDERKPIDGKESEILQLPHAFRHQQHYSHRIEQAVNDFRQQQLKQLQASHLKERDKLTKYINSKNNNNNNSNDNNNNKKNNIQTDNNYNNNNKDDDKKYEQSTNWQKNLNAPEQQEHHQRRHEHHWLQEEKKQEVKDTKISHLRHRHHYATSLSLPFSSWDKHNNVPALRHQRHRNGLIITTTIAPNIGEPITEADNELDKNNAEYKNNDDMGNRNLRHRVINSMSLSLPTTNLNYSYRRQPPTRGPLILRNRVPSTSGPSKLRHQKQKAYAKNSMYSDEIDEPLSGRRLSLKMHRDDVENEELEKLNDKITRDFVNELDVDSDNDDDRDYDENYSYEEDLNYDDTNNEDKLNHYPTNKLPVKRFTNIYKSFSSSDLKLKKNTNNDNVNNNNKNNNKDDDVDDDDDDETIPDDKLRLRMQQHHMRQQQHQHELEALRAKHGGLVVATNNMVNSGPNKHNTNIKTNNNQASSKFIFCSFTDI